MNLRLNIQSCLRIMSIISNFQLEKCINLDSVIIHNLDLRSIKSVLHILKGLTDPEFLAI